MAGRGTFARRLMVAGAAISFVAWATGGRRRDEDPIEDAPLIPDDVAIAGARGLDPPRGRRPFRSRLAASLVFATIFCAGAALTAGAGNEVAQQMDATPLAEQAPVEASAEEAPPPEQTAAEQPAAEQPAAEQPAAEAAPAEEPAPAAEPAEPAAAEPAVEPEPAPAEPAPAVEAEAPAPAAEAPAAVEPDPSDATPAKPAATDVVEPVTVSAPTHRTTAKRAPVKRIARRAVPRPQAVAVPAIPFQALAFDPQEWLNDNPATSTGAAALAIAAHYLGVPYRWGGSLPATGFDCSGLTMFVYDQLGVRLPHYAASQFAMFTKLDPTDLRPGDLVFFEPKFDGPGHVAVYAGGDRILEAPHTGALVRYASFSRAAAALGFLGAVRPYGAVAEEPLVFGNTMYKSPFIHAE